MDTVQNETQVAPEIVAEQEVAVVAATPVEEKPAQVKKATPAKKSATVKKTAAKKTEIKLEVKEKTVIDTQERDAVAMAAKIYEDQFDNTTDTIVGALTALSQQLEEARATGNARGKAIVEGFGGESKLASLIADLAGYMGEAAAAGMTMGATPVVVMAGAAKGIYKKITE